jgi:DNA polymerase-3 subunit epsilon
VKVEGAHNATVDALLAARVAYKMACWYPDLAAMKLDDLHQMQVEGKAEHAKFLAAYLRREGKHAEADAVRPEWPYIPEELALWD